MIVIKSKWFTGLLGVRGIMLFPFCITRFPNDQKHINHERIHFWQAVETGVVGFYVLYLYYLIRYGNYTRLKGRDNIPFELEAYTHDDNLNYLKTRKPYAWARLNKKKQNEEIL